jgi:glycosyltransferase involved in cell wall biosynthesis
MSKFIPRPRSVCLVVQNVYDIDIRVRRKAEALVAAGYHVDVLAIRSPRRRAKVYTLNGVNVHSISLGKKRGSPARYYFEYFIFFCWALAKLSMMMARRRYRVIDVNTLPDFLVFAAACPKWRGAKIILDMHEIMPEFLMSKYGVDNDHWQVRLARWLERVSFTYADHILTINEPIQQLLASRGLPTLRSTIIMNAADESMFLPAACPPTVADGIAEKKGFVFIYHGTLTRIYGVDIMIEAFATAHPKIPGAELWIIGEGPEKKSLEKLSAASGVNSSVRFLGSMPPTEIAAWLARSDVGVLATRQDIFLDYSFSNKLSEYIIMGKAVIASRLRTLRHYFSEGALAYFEPHRPADLARKMTLLYRNEGLRAQLVEKAKEEYAPISWAVMKQRYLSRVESLTAASRGSEDLI